MRALQIFLATMAGGVVVFAAMYPLTTGTVNLRFDGDGLNVTGGLVAIMAGLLLLLVLVCDTLSRHVEAGLAAWRAAKRSARIAWVTELSCERKRLEV